MKQISTYYTNLLNSVVNAKLQRYEINIETGKLQGENFLGDIIFVHLTHRETKEELHLVIKRAVRGFQFLENIFAAEINFYEKIWPVLNEFQGDVGFNKIAKYYASCRTVGEESIVLENLIVQNYRLLDKTKVLDREHIDFIFKSYGTFHAISYAFRERYPEEFFKLENLTSIYGLGPPEDTTPEKKAGFNYCLRANLDNVLSLFDELTEKDILVAYKEYIKDEPAKMFRESLHYTGDTPVLIHGDCWSNNMMFKYNEDGKVIDMKFLDFQMVMCGSPVSDLSYCLYAGASKDTLDKLDDLLKIYIDSFQETLTNVNCTPKQPYTFDKLKSEWKHYGKFGFMISILVWGIKFVDKNYVPVLSEQEIDMPKIAEEYAYEYQHRVRDLVQHFYENGFL